MTGGYLERALKIRDLSHEALSQPRPVRPLTKTEKNRRMKMKQKEKKKAEGRAKASEYYAARDAMMEELSGNQDIPIFNPPTSAAGSRPPGDSDEAIEKRMRCDSQQGAARPVRRPPLL